MVARRIASALTDVTFHFEEIPVLSAAVDALLGSNLVGIFAMSLLGCGLYVIYRLQNRCLDALGWMFALGVIASSLMAWGEVYAYSEWYRRAFFYYGDGVTTVIAFFAAYAAWNQRIALTIVSFVALTVSGGKVPLVLFAVLLFLLMKFTHSHPVLNKRGIASLAAIAVLGYFCVTGIANLLGGETRVPSPGYSACENGEKCFHTQFMWPLRERVFSSIGGAWMMISGGYRGEAWPNTDEQFADLMVRENPWDINERFGISRSQWRKIGVIQNPYLKFGAGYGPVAFGAIGLFVLALNAMAFRNLISSAHEGAEPPIILFFIVNTLLNQTQSWLESRSIILVLLSFCGCAILTSWVRRRALARAKQRCAEDNAVA